MKKFAIIFEGGESTTETYYNPDTMRVTYRGCNYMMCTAEDRDGDEVDLYAEYLAPDDLEESGVDAFERESYPALKAEILKKAEENDVDPETLDFSAWEEFEK